MPPVDNRLLVRRLRTIRDAAQDGSPTDEQWADAREVFAATQWEDAGIEAAFEGRETGELDRRLEEWDGGKQPFPPHDRAVMKRALKAFRKRVKLQQLDEESQLGGGPFSRGQHSSVVAIQPPNGYPAEVWEELARQGRLRDHSDGFFELLEG